MGEDLTKDLPIWVSVFLLVVVPEVRLVLAHLFCDLLLVFIHLHQLSVEAPDPIFQSASPYVSHGLKRGLVHLQLFFLVVVKVLSFESHVWCVLICHDLSCRE